MTSLGSLHGVAQADAVPMQRKLFAPQLNLGFALDGDILPLELWSMNTNLSRRRSILAWMREAKRS